MGEEPRCPGAGGGKSLEEIYEVPQDLRILRQLGDHAVAELVVRNAFFDKFNRGELGAQERGKLREQLNYLRPHVRKLAVAGIEEALKANDPQTAQALQQITLYLLQDSPENETLVVHSGTLTFLRAINELMGKRDFIQIAAAILALMRMAPVERLISDEPYHPQSVRARTRKQLGFPQDSGNAAGVLRQIAGSDESFEEHLGRDLEHAIRMYVTARYTFQEGILKGIDAVIDAKKTFYKDLADTLAGDQTPARNVDFSNPLEYHVGK